MKIVDFRAKVDQVWAFQLMKSFMKVLFAFHYYMTPSKISKMENMAFSGPKSDNFDIVYCRFED